MTATTTTLRTGLPVKLDGVTYTIVKLNCSTADGQHGLVMLTASKRAPGDAPALRLMHPTDVLALLRPASAKPQPQPQLAYDDDMVIVDYDDAPVWQVHPQRRRYFAHPPLEDAELFKEES